jgi:hypothetical protein
MRRFYLRGLIEEKMGVEADRKAADSAFVQAAAIAEKAARYKHAQLSSIRLAGDINATGLPDNRKLGPARMTFAARRIRRDQSSSGSLITAGSLSSPSSPSSSSSSSSSLGSRGGTATPTRVSQEKMLPDMRWVMVGSRWSRCSTTDFNTREPGPLP